MVSPRLVFDFITDEEFRAALESDYREMQDCLAQGAWKAVHVLAGSIVEAVLVDYLVGAGQKKPDPLQMQLGDLIAACQKAGVLTQKTADLSSALKSFRNLIHPGRVKRLGERADADGGIVAQALVSIIVREVAAKQQERYGPTAEQIITKFETDPSALGIAQHLLKEARAHEIDRLLTKVLPDRYFDQLENEFYEQSVLDGHSRLFRAAFTIASDASKKKVASRHVAVLKEEAGLRVRVYEEEFFRGGDLEYLKDEDQALVKAHLFAGLRTSPSVKLLSAIRGIGPWIGEDDVPQFVDPLVRLAVGETDQRIARAARAVLEGEALRTKPRRRHESC